MLQLSAGQLSLLKLCQGCSLCKTTPTCYHVQDIRVYRTKLQAVVTAAGGATNLQQVNLRAQMNSSALTHQLVQDCLCPNKHFLMNLVMTEDSKYVYSFTMLIMQFPKLVCQGWATFAFCLEERVPFYLLKLNLKVKVKPSIC